MDNITYFPAETLHRWNRNAKKSALWKLKSLCEFRAGLVDAKAENVLDEAYREASDAMMCPPETLRRNLWIIREYPERQIRRWIVNGVSFHHIERANSLDGECPYAPAVLLNKAIDLGDGNGKTMTVDEMTNFAMGEKPKRSFIFKVNLFFANLCNLHTRLKLNWSPQKVKEFEADVELLKKKYFDEGEK